MNNFEPDTRRQSTADKNLHTKDEEGTAGFDVTCNGVRSFSEYEINNPFRLPSTTDVTKFLQQEKEKERVEHKLFLRKPIHMKTTKSGREGTMCSDILKSIPPVHLPKEPPKSPTNNIRSDPEFLKALATGEKMRNMENVSSFVKTKREMFLLQYLIGVKTDELMKMDEHEKDKVQRLEIQEKELEEDAIKFDTFLKSNDREAVEAYFLIWVLGGNIFQTSEGAAGYICRFRRNESHVHPEESGNRRKFRGSSGEIKSK